jgi:hypothetical protein
MTSDSPTFFQATMPRPSGGNTANVTPDMLLADPSILQVLHAKIFPDRAQSPIVREFYTDLQCIIAVTASDDLFGAVTRDGRFIVTSPNSKHILDPPLGRNRSLFLRSNLRFGDDDALQWPQPFLANYGHVACIRMPPSDKNDPRNIMWVLPGHAGFVPDDGISGGIGKLCDGFFRSMTQLWDILLERAITPKFNDIQLVSELVTHAQTPLSSSRVYLHPIPQNADDCS